MIAGGSDRLRRIAAAHVLTLEDANASEENVLAALAWIEADNEHYQLAREISRFSLICDQLPEDVAAEVARHDVPRRGDFFLRIPAQRAIAAALALVMIGLGVVAFQMGLLSPRPSQTSSEYFTTIGEVRSVILSDRTRVALGAASSIRVTYDEGFRRVSLISGEAFFDVTKNKKRPFIVETDDGEVTALGTAFNVHRSTDATTVTLLRGLVKVKTTQSDNGPVAILRPNSQIEINRLGGLSEVRSVDSDAAVAWREGSYRYSDTPLATIVSDLRRYYGKPIVLASANLNNMRFTGVVNLTSNDIEQWLMGLQRLEDISVSIRKDVVLISEKAGRTSG